MIDVEGRHPGTQGLARWLTHNPNLPEGLPLDVALVVEHFAACMIDVLPDGPELSAGLRHLLEAKDALVRASLDGVRP